MHPRVLQALRQISNMQPVPPSQILPSGKVWTAAETCHLHKLLYLTRGTPSFQQRSVSVRTKPYVTDTASPTQGSHSLVVQDQKQEVLSFLRLARSVGPPEGSLSLSRDSPGAPRMSPRGPESFPQLALSRSIPQRIAGHVLALFAAGAEAEAAAEAAAGPPEASSAPQTLLCSTSPASWELPGGCTTKSTVADVLLSVSQPRSVSESVSQFNSRVNSSQVKSSQEPLQSAA